MKQNPNCVAGRTLLPNNFQPHFLPPHKAHALTVFGPINFPMESAGKTLVLPSKGFRYKSGGTFQADFSLALTKMLP